MPPSRFLVILICVRRCQSLHHPPIYSPALAASIQPWGVSTLREQIKAGYVTKAAFHEEQRSSIEVLDVNGLQRRVEIFPAVAPLLVSDLQEAHVTFFVASAPTPSPLLPLLHACALTMAVMWIIAILGMMDSFIFGCIILGNELTRLGQQLECLLIELSTVVAAGKVRHEQSMQALKQALLGQPAAASSHSTASISENVWAATALQQVEPVPVRVEEEADEREI